MRPIDANELKTHSFQVDMSDCESESAVLLRDIDEAPTLDVRPVVHGHWIHPSRNSKINNKAIFSDCSVCGYSVAVIDARDYCPNCGAILDEKEAE